MHACSLHPVLITLHAVFVCWWPQAPAETLPEAHHFQAVKQGPGRYGIYLIVTIIYRYSI